MKNSHYGKHRLADMDMTPKSEYYQHPSDASIRDDDRMSIDAETEIYFQTWVKKNLVVWFVIEQWHYPDGTGDRTRIARVDCCLGMVHEHRFNFDGEDVLDHRPIKEIPVDATPDFVDTAYSEALTYVIEYVERNVEWWRRSRSAQY